MPVPQLDLAVPKGTKVVQPVLVTTNGLSVPLPNGTKAKMQIRTSRLSSVVKAELSSDNGRLVVDAATAKVTITLVSAFTATFDFERGVYDLDLIYPDNEKERIVEGKVYVFPAVTQ